MILENILPALLENLTKLLPFRLPIVRSYQQGVKFRFGNDIKLLGTGLHFNWAFFESIEIIDTVPEVIETQILAITTIDNKVVCVSAGIQYEIMDARLYWTKVKDFNSSLSNLAEGMLAHIISQWELSEIINDQQSLTRELQGDLQDKVRDWGVNIIATYLCNIAPSRSIRVIGDTNIIHTARNII